MRVKIMTSIYSDLYGSELGGRQGRKDHYRFSLLSLLKMSQADFICYTSDRELDDLKEFFYKNHNISEDRLKFVLFDLPQTLAVHTCGRNCFSVLCGGAIFLHCEFSKTERSLDDADCLCWNSNGYVCNYSLPQIQQRANWFYFFRSIHRYA